MRVETAEGGNCGFPTVIFRLVFSLSQSGKVPEFERKPFHAVILLFLLMNLFCFLKNGSLIVLYFF